MHCVVNSNKFNNVLIDRKWAAAIGCVEVICKALSISMPGTDMQDWTFYL